MSGARHSRAAAPEDAPAIFQLVKTYADRGNLLPRTMEELHRSIAEFRVTERDGIVIACGALEVFTPELGEIRSLVVAPETLRHGIGRGLVLDLIGEARAAGLKRLMVLTYVPEFFQRLGFVVVPRDAFPEKVWKICVQCYKRQDCDEIAMCLGL